jgi:hypothetical protein
LESEQAGITHDDQASTSRIGVVATADSFCLLLFIAATIAVVWGTGFSRVTTQCYTNGYSHRYSEHYAYGYFNGNSHCNSYYYRSRHCHGLCLC